MISPVESAYFCHQDKRGVLKVELSIVYSILVETLSHISVFIFTSGLVGEFVKSLLFSYWILLCLV